MHETSNAIIRARTLLVQSDGQEAPIVDENGRLIRLQAGWSPLASLKIDNEFSLQLLAHENGSYATWVIKQGRIFIGDFLKIRNSLPEWIGMEITKFLMNSLSKIVKGQQLDLNDPRIMAALSKIIDYKLFGKFRLLTASNRKTATSSEIFTATRRWMRAFPNGVLEPRELPALFKKSLNVERARLVPLDRLFRVAAVLCWTKQPGKEFIIIIHDRHKGTSDQQIVFMWSLDDNTFYVDEFSETHESMKSNFLVNFFDTVPMLHENSRSLQEVERGGIILTGIANFGHGVWDELQAVDRLIGIQPQWAAKPAIYVLKAYSGAALYGDLEDFYPELKGQFFYCDTFNEAIQKALAAGVQLFALSGRRALRATRNRLIDLAAQHGKRNRLDFLADKKFRHQHFKLPVIALGLRLTNRHPVDFLGFYERLIRHLVAQFGRIGVVIDGMNSDPQNGGAAAKIFNADKIVDGSTEIDKENDFVSRLLEVTNSLPVQFINCVGQPIRENLFWLSLVDFFVAPHGGGVAKLRWALDVPGYLLVSGENLDNYSLLNCYCDSRYMDEPFTDLHMNKLEEVEDAPLSSPASKSSKPRDIPHGINFYLDEPKVFAKISQLLAIKLEARNLLD